MMISKSAFVVNQAGKRSSFSELYGDETNTFRKGLPVMISPLELDFPAISNRAVTARFDGGDLSSDAGVVLLAVALRAN